MVTRQKILLRFMEQTGETISRLRLTKLCFLLSREGDLATRSPVAYQFTPYLWGPYSFTLVSELGALIGVGVRPGVEAALGLVVEDDGE